MTAETLDDTQDKPLDPAVEAVRKRLARLLAVSIGIMMIGLLAVLGAIVYKMSGPSGAAVADGSLSVPAGMTVVDQSLDGDRLALRLRKADGSEVIAIYALSDGRRIGRFILTPVPE
jgi:hypothetical protein